MGMAVVNGRDDAYLFVCVCKLAAQGSRFMSYEPDSTLTLNHIFSILGKPLITDAKLESNAAHIWWRT